MIRNDLKRLLDQKGVNPYRLHKETKIHMATALKLYHDSGYIPRPDVMERLAEVYGWQPGWYISYIPKEIAENLASTV